MTGLADTLHDLNAVAFLVWCMILFCFGVVYGIAWIADHW